MKKLLLSILTALPILANAQNQTVVFWQPFNSATSSTLSHYLKASGEGAIAESARFSLLPTSNQAAGQTTTDVNTHYSTNAMYEVTANGFTLNHTAAQDHKISPYIKALGLPNGGSGANELIFLQMDLQFAITGGLTSSTPLFFQLGNYTAFNSSADPSGGSPAASNDTQPYAIMGVKFPTAANLGKFQFSNSNISTTNYDGAVVNHITWVINKTGASKQYIGLDGNVATVNVASSDIWLGTTKIGTIAENSNATGKTQNITDLRIRTAGVWQGSIYIKNLAIGYIPADGTGQVLPVELNAFIAKTNGSSVNLSWKTNSESNFSHFDITRSTDGSKFVKIGERAAKGPSNYNYTDYSPVKGNNYYQLIAKDKDGKTEKSTIVTAKVATSGLDLTITPTASGLDVNLNALKAGNVTIKLVTVNGQILATSSGNLTSGNNKFSIPTVYNGLLIVNAVTTDGTVSRKIIK